MNKALLANIKELTDQVKQSRAELDALDARVRLTAEQKAMRDKGVFASMVGTICGLNPHETPLSLYLKHPTIGEIPPFSGNVSTLMGHALEPIHAAQCAAELGCKACGGWLNGDELAAADHGCVLRSRPGETRQHPTVPWLFATPDRYVTIPGLPQVPVEVKSTSMFPKAVKSYLPMWYAQLACQLMVCDLPVGLLVVGFRNQTPPQIHRVHRSDSFDSLIIDCCGKWWNDHVLARVPPPDSFPAIRRAALMNKEAMKQALVDLIDSMDDRIAFRLPGAKKPVEMEAANEPMEEDTEEMDDEDDGETPKALLAIIKKKRAEG